MKTLQKTLLEIEKSQSFEKLEPFKNSKIWKRMTKEDRDLFAFLLIKQGAQQLKRGESKILDNFALAAEVSHYSADIFNQQGIIFSEFTENTRCLQLACQSFEKATERNPEFFLAWYNWGNICIEQGLLQGETAFFDEARVKYEKALSLWDPSKEISKGTLYWKLGVSFSLLGRLFGEPIDLSQALKHFRTAAELECKDFYFYNDYGQALAHLSSLIEKQELLLDAILLFRKTIEAAPQFFEGWLNLSCCIFRLCEMDPTEERFAQGYEGFEKASQLEPLNSLLWVKWAQLEACYGKFRRNTHMIESSLAKFAKADELESGNPLILRYWAETELFLGSNHERLDLIKSARLKIIKSLEIHSECPEAWYTYGACLNDLGRYFEEPSYYHQALEKFHYGLSLSPQHPILLYGVAIAHFALGELTSDQSMLEKSIRYCSRVIECGGEAFPQFWNDWGVGLLKLGELTNQINYVEWAIEKFEKAIKNAQDSDFDDVDLEWVYNLGCAYDMLGELKEDSLLVEKAVNVLHQVVQIDPFYIHARYNLAISLSHLGEMTCDAEPYFKAVEHFQMLIEIDSEDESMQMDYALSLIHLGVLLEDEHHPERSHSLFREAELHLMQSASLGNTAAYYTIACLYSLTGLYSLAMHFIDRAKGAGSLPSVDEMMHDEWLGNLHSFLPFKNFLNQLQSKEDE